MMAAKSNHPWTLNAFLDALIYELDLAQDALSVKGKHRKLTYMVRDMSLDLQLFPEFDGELVRFVTARPGEAGASKISLQLSSIRDHQIQEVAQDPISHRDISLEETELPERIQTKLKRLGIRSVEDLRRAVEDLQIDLDAHTEEQIDSDRLQPVLNQARRRQQEPVVFKARMSKVEGESVLILEGENLMVFPNSEEFPVAILDGERVPVIAASEDRVRLRVDRDRLKSQPGQLKIALDRYAVVTMNLKI